MRFPGPPHWCKLGLKIYARDHLWLPFLRSWFFLFCFPSSVLLSMKSHPPQVPCLWVVVRKVHLHASEFYLMLISYMVPQVWGSLDFDSFVSSKLQLHLFWISRCPQGKRSLMAVYFSRHLLPSRVCLGISSYLLAYLILRK